jgi:flagellar protein FliO/FliZ
LGLARFLQVVGGLAAVLLVIGAAAYVLRRSTLLRSAGGKRLNVIEAVSIGARDRLVLIDVDGQQVLVGISPGRIQALMELKGTQGFEQEYRKSLGAVREAAS